MTTQAAEELDIFNAGVKPGKQLRRQLRRNSLKRLRLTRSRAIARNALPTSSIRSRPGTFGVGGSAGGSVRTCSKMLPKAQTSAPQQQPTPVQQAAPVSNVSDVLAPQEPLAPAADPEQAGITVEQLNALNEQVGAWAGSS